MLERQNFSFAKPKFNAMNNGLCYKAVITRQILRDTANAAVILLMLRNVENMKIMNSIGNWVYKNMEIGN